MSTSEFHKQDAQLWSNATIGPDHSNSGAKKRSLATVIQYQNLARRLTDRARRHFGIDRGEVDPTTVASYLVEIMSSVRKRTFRLYRAALVYHFEEIATPEALRARDFIRDEIGYDSIFEDEVGSDVEKSKTSSHKSKRVSDEDLKAIYAELRQSKSKWAGAAGAWLRAGMLTGLRPIEWIDVRYVDEVGVPYLLVNNAKNTHGRAHGDSRKVILEGLTERELELIKKHIQLVRAHVERGLYAFFYKQCQRLLHSVSSKLFPWRLRRITLYSGRHQFAADAKSTLSKAEVAALMGHASMRTAGLHYGLSAHGSGNLRVTPDNEDVERVIAIARNEPLEVPGVSIDDFLTM